MDAQRARARAAGATAAGSSDSSLRDQARLLADRAGAPTNFTGYETVRQMTTVGALEPAEAANGSPAGGGAGNGSGEPPAGARYLLKLADSPFYAPGGGQVADHGTIECERGDCLATVENVFRLGEDQAIEVSLQRGRLEVDEPVLARVDPRLRHATEANHTATHLLQAALREILGPHVRQAGSYVGPDKLRFDFTHGGALSPEELAAVEDRVNGWIAENQSVHAFQTTLVEARRLGAMALFGEKYGEIVRMVEVGDGSHSRELCGGTHVHRTAEIGPFLITSETSSSSNVRRIEALTGPAAVEHLRADEARLKEIAGALRTAPAQAPEAVHERERERRELEKRLRSGEAGPGAGGIDAKALAEGAQSIAGVPILAASVPGADPQALLQGADRLRGLLPGAAVVLGSVDPDPGPPARVHLLVSIAPELVPRGLRAGDIVKRAAAVVGGGGGGRDTLAQAGGRDPQKLPEAIEVARSAITSALEA